MPISYQPISLGPAVVKQLFTHTHTHTPADTHVHDTPQTNGPAYQVPVIHVPFM